MTREVILKNGKILVVKTLGTTNTFLPGGHIEIGERAEDALKREIKEEINQQAQIKEHLGAIAQAYKNPVNGRILCRTCSAEGQHYAS